MGNKKVLAWSYLVKWRNLQSLQIVFFNVRYRRSRIQWRIERTFRVQSVPFLHVHQRHVDEGFLYCPAKRMYYHQLRTIVIGRIKCAIIGLWPISRIILNIREWCFCFSVQTVFPWTNLGNKVQNDDFYIKISIVCICKMGINQLLHNSWDCNNISTRNLCVALQTLYSHFYGFT